MESNWPLIAIEEIGVVKSGKRLPKGDELVEFRTEFPYIRLVDVSEGRIESTKLKFLRPETQGKISRYIVNTDDVCLAIVGHTIGMVFYINEKWDGVNLTENAARITNVVQDFNPRFIYYYLNSSIGQSEILSRKVGSAQGKLPLYNIKSLEIPKLPKAYQDSVVRILGNIDSKIELNQQTNQTLEQMAQTLFKSWFVDFDPVFDNLLAKVDFDLTKLPNDFPKVLLKRAEKRLLALNANESSDASASTLGTTGTANKADLQADKQAQSANIHQHFPSEFEFNEQLGWIPKGWEESNVGSEFDVTMGQSPPGSTYNEINEGIPFFQGKTDYGFRFPSNRIYCTAPKRLANKNDTLVSVRAPVGTINLAAEKCAIGRGLAAVRHKSGSISFTYYAMNDLAKHFAVFEGEGTVFGSINQKDFNALPQLSVPPNIASLFNQYCTSWDEKIELTSLQTDELTKLRDTLLPKLISGELQITESEG